MKFCRFPNGIASSIPGLGGIMHKYLAILDKFSKK